MRRLTRKQVKSSRKAYWQQAGKLPKKKKAKSRFTLVVSSSTTTTGRAMKTRSINIIELEDWNAAIRGVYGKPYDLQQQDGFRSRGVLWLTVPDISGDEYMHEEIPEIVNHHKMGVKFRAWLGRDPSKGIPLDPVFDFDSPEERGRSAALSLELWWHRNFYPDVRELANDLHGRGLLEAGEYGINIDW